MHKTFYGKIIGSLMSKYSPDLENKVCGDQNQEASFCMNRCPHPEASCKGYCTELLDYRKSHSKQHSIGGIH